MCRLFLIGAISKLRLIFKVGPKKYVLKLKKSRPKLNSVGLVAIIKNERIYIKEWIDYHILIGVDKIYIYDNESTDGIKEVLQTYIDKGIVEYRFFPGKGVQEKAYLDCMKEASTEVDWLVTLDIDEFLQSVSGIDMKKWLNSFSYKVSQIEVGWIIYGSNGHISRPNGLVIENFTKHAEYTFISDYKPIVRPSRVIGMSFPHQYKVAGKTVDESGKTIWAYPEVNVKGARPAKRNIFRVNHYYSKSLEEFEQKSRRGDASRPEREPRSIKDFKTHDKNEVTDLSMIQYVDKLKNI